MALGPAAERPDGVYVMEKKGMVYRRPRVEDVSASLEGAGGDDGRSPQEAGEGVLPTQPAPVAVSEPRAEKPAGLDAEDRVWVEEQAGRVADGMRFQDEIDRERREPCGVLGFFSDRWRWRGFSVSL